MPSGDSMSSEDSKQLSVAELLARNAAQGATPPSGGGGRRRRSGRGLSVTDLTGENAAVRPASSHAAPAPEPQAPSPTYAPEPAPTSYEPPASYEPAPYPPPGPAEPAYSPMSGPITRFDPHSGFSAPDPNDPLGVTGSRPSSDPFGPFRAEARDTAAPTNGRGPGRLGAPGPAQPVDPGIAELFGSGALPEVPSTGGGRRRRADPEETQEPPQPPPVAGGRAARRRAAEAAEEAAAPAAPAAWSPSPEPTGYAPPSFDAPYGPGPQAPFGQEPFNPGFGTGFDGRPDAGYGVPPGFNDYQDGGFKSYQPPAPAFGAQPPEPAQAFGSAPVEATQAFTPEAPPAWPQEPDQRPQLDRRRGAPEAGKSGGLPSWSARRHRPDPAPESGGFPTAAWSPVSQEQPLVAGQSVAGDLLRQQADQDADARTEVYRLGPHRPGAEPDTDDYAESDYVDRDYADNDYSDADYADGEYDDDYDDYEPEPKRAKGGRRAAAKARAAEVASRAKSRAASRMASTKAGSRTASRVSAGRAGSRVAARSAEEENRRQWLILGGQSLGAAVAGMLLFKGFETMWETLPWVALALAMVVILGLVALVRILRRTDDIYSTVIAVVVGVFVTLGPLAFLLSTS
ncbi:hypothetical protein DFR69_107247 [Nocardia neocaledoniensis]|uniref:Uncharacterized protein n=2 Tax=Nocardia neocaledoniensis TaxID=236511 RepID=A0A317NF24_9NOCA|nr:hypothetical protein DFR69_107247 [Nocardia neocaledoniensis]